MRCNRTEPDRLATVQYISLDAPLRVYHQQLHEPVALHWHEFYEMAFILAGEGVHVLNGMVHQLVPGSLFLLTPADFHELIPQRGTIIECYNVIFLQEALSTELRYLVFDEVHEYGTIFSQTDFTPMAAEFQRLWSETQQPRLGQQLVVRATFERILVDLARRCGEGTTREGASTSGQRYTISPALTYLQHHFREELTLEAVAQQVHLSPNYFSECFHTATGVSFQTHLQGLRLRFACSLLAVSPTPITHVCFASGFTSLSQFERAFKRAYGLSPGAYRCAMLELGSQQFYTAESGLWEATEKHGRPS